MLVLIYWVVCWLQTAEDDNEIGEICKKIDQTISRTLQVALHDFEKDMTVVLDAINKELTTNQNKNKDNQMCMFFCK